MLQKRAQPLANHLPIIDINRICGRASPNNGLTEGCLQWRRSKTRYAFSTGRWIWFMHSLITAVKLSSSKRHNRELANSGSQHITGLFEPGEKKVYRASFNGTVAVNTRRKVPSAFPVAHLIIAGGDPLRRLKRLLWKKSLNIFIIETLLCHLILFIIYV